MPDFANFIQWEGLGFLFALFAIVIMRILTGDLATRGLIAGVTFRGSSFVSAGRVQLLIVSMVAAVQYLSQVWDNPQSFPDIPQNWLLLFAGSQVLYLGAKFHGRRNGSFFI